MKKISLLGVFFMMTVMLFTSCLGDGSNMVEREEVGVVTVHDKTFEKVLDVGGGIYFRAPDFDIVNEGVCYYVYYRLDYDLPENANPTTAGYYTVTILRKEEFERHGMALSITDTSKVIENELPIKNPVYQLFRYYKDRLFLGHLINQPKNQQNYWDLSYDYQNMVTEENGMRTYELYIRASVRSESSNSPEDQLKLCAYEASNFFRAAANNEKNEGESTLYFRFNYVSEIKDGKITWAKTDRIPISVTLILPE